MTNIDSLITQLLLREGGYTNDPHDAGGETNWGITAAVARQQGYLGAMRDMPRDEAAAIYKRLYWLKPSFDQVDRHSSALAAELFDAGVNMGVETACKFLQRALTDLNRRGRDYPDLVVDGNIGPGTLAALDAFLRVRGAPGAAVLLKAVICIRGEDYLEIAEKHPQDEDYVYGWLANRVGVA